MVNSMLDRKLLLQRGQEYHKSGNLQAAAKIYKDILSGNPKNEEALYLLGCLAHQTGSSQVAVDLLERAIKVNSRQADYQNALATALFSLGREDDAEIRLRRAIALEARPGFYRSLVMILKKQDRINDAIDCLEHALRGSPLQPSNLALLRELLRSTGRADEAPLHLEKAIALLPRDDRAQCDFGDALLDAGDAVGAAAVYSGVLEENPHLDRAWYSEGCAQEAQQEYGEAVKCFERAVQLRSEWLEARHNLGRALYELGQVGPAFEQFKWCGAQPGEQSKHSRAMMAVIVPGVPDADNQVVLDVRRDWVERDLISTTNTGESPPRQARKQLRIGYVSSFFHRDNWMKPVWGLINHHDRANFEISLFSDAPKNAIRHGYRPHNADQFFDTLNLSNEALATLIRKCGIDLLVDLNGYSNMKRLPMFMLRPAPKIIGWFNMYATTGMDVFDYLIGDNHVIPPDEERFYAEKILRVPGSYLTFNVDYPVPPIAEVPCTRNERITFGSLGSQYKMTTEVVATWSRIVTNTPSSRLLLKNKHLASPSTRDFTRQLFAQHGVEGERLQLEGPEDHFDFLKGYGRVDVALDTFPYNGGTTTTEAIWQGVPVVTFSGDRWASRTSASILRTGGLGEFVADDLPGFIALATQLGSSAHTRGRLVEFRKNIRSNLQASPVCDSRGLARSVEGIYQILR